MLDLHEIIDLPGASLEFSREMPEDELKLWPVVGFTSPPLARGTVRNSAGALTLSGTISADMLCVCDRCGEQFAQQKRVDLLVPLAADLEDEENPDIFPVHGTELDLDELLKTCFILDMDAKMLCREDCKGLCERCGANLNRGPCSCGRQTDPRMAVLAQLLDNTE